MLSLKPPGYIFKRLEMLDDKLAEVQATLLTQVDGLLAGVIVCPTPAPSGEWLSVVLWTEDGEPVVFSDSKQRETLVGLLIDYHGRLVQDLDAGSIEASFRSIPAATTCAQNCGPKASCWRWAWRR